MAYAGPDREARKERGRKAGRAIVAHVKIIYEMDEAPGKLKMHQGVMQELMAEARKRRREAKQKMAATCSCPNPIRRIAVSISTTLDSKDRSIRKPCCSVETVLAMMGSVRRRTALAMRRLSILTVANGRASSGR